MSNSVQALPWKRKILWWTLLCGMTYSATLVFSADRAAEIVYLPSMRLGFFESSLLFVLLFYTFSRFLRKQEVRVTIGSALGAFVFSAIMICGYSLSTYESLFPPQSSLFSAFVWCLFFFGYFSLFYTLLQFLLAHLMRGYTFIDTDKELFLFRATFPSTMARVAILFGIWLVYFIINYPGIVTTDTMDMILQGLGIIPLNNHHPAFLALVMGSIIQLGQMLFGRYSAGVALFSIFQMLCMAGVFSYVIGYLAKKKIRVLWRCLLFVGYALFPVFAMYSFSLWKDVWLGLLFLLYICLLVEIGTNMEVFHKNKRNYVFLFVVVVLLCFMKNTGIYLFLLSFPFVLFIQRKYWKPILLSFLIILVGFWGSRTLLFTSLSVSEGGVQEMLSIPLQQLARVVREAPEVISSQEEATLRRVMTDYDSVGADYTPKISDPIKFFHFDGDEFKKDPAAFGEVWFQLFLKRPDIYFTATALNSYGYFYPDVYYWINSDTIYYDSLAVYQQLDSYITPIVNSESFAETPNTTFTGLQKSIIPLNEGLRRQPLFGMFYSIGCYTFALIFTLILTLCKKNYRFLPPIIASFVVLLTCVASPVYAEFRYALPYIMATPILLILMGSKTAVWCRSAAPSLLSPRKDETND